MGGAIVSNNAIIGKDVTIRGGAVIEDGVVIGDGCYIDYGAILKENVSIGANSFVGAGCILGEFLMDFFKDKTNSEHPLVIGNEALIRSGTIIYGETNIGDYFQTGHRATIREKAVIGNHASIGTLSDVQGYCTLGEYVRLHSNVFLAQQTILHDYVWLFPHVVITNDPTPPSETELGVEAFDYAVIGAGAVVLPGKKIGRDALVGAGAVVTKDVDEGMAVAGNPAKPMCRVVDIKAGGKDCYPWKNFFDRGMPWANEGTTK